MMMMIGITIPGHTDPGNNSNEWVLHTLPISKTGTFSIISRTLDLMVSNPFFKV